MNPSFLFVAFFTAPQRLTFSFQYQPHDILEIIQNWQDSPDSKSNMTYAKISRCVSPSLQWVASASDHLQREKCVWFRDTEPIAYRPASHLLPQSL